MACEEFSRCRQRLHLWLPCQSQRLTDVLGVHDDRAKVRRKVPNGSARGADYGFEPPEGLVLRYESLYGPGTAISLASDAQMAALVRKRRFPIVGDGAGVWSHVNVDDAVAATLISVEQGEVGIYNVVDDELAPVRE